MSPSRGKTRRKTHATLKFDGGELSSLLHNIAETGICERPEGKTIRKLLAGLEEIAPWLVDDFKGLVE